MRVLVDGSLWIRTVQPDDGGLYTCMPSNGLPPPPSASAVLTVLCESLWPSTDDLLSTVPSPCFLPSEPALPVPPDPALVMEMPLETPLPIGMPGVIRCPVRANPPLLFVSWTKDGQALQLDKVLAGWKDLNLPSLS